MFTDKRSWRRLAVGAVAISMALMASACGSSSSSGDSTYKIGALLALTGPYSALGTDEQKSIKLFADTVNAKGGINGHKVEVVVADTGSDESQAVNQFRKLATSDDVVAIVGPSSSGEGTATKSISSSLRTPQIVPASSDAIITPASDAKYSFKEFPSTKSSLQAQLAYAKDQGWTKVAILAANDQYGQEPVQELPGMVGSYGLTLVGKSLFSPDATDVTPQLSSLASKKPDVTLVWAVNPANAIVAKNAKSINYPGVLFNSPGAATDDYIKVAGSAAQGTLVQGSKLAAPESIKPSDPQYAALQGLLKAWSKKYGGSPSQYAANGWDCMLILQKALKGGKVQPADTQQTRDSIQQALSSQINDLAGINAIYNFTDTQHGPAGIKGLAVLSVKANKFTLVKSY